MPWYSGQNHLVGWPDGRDEYLEGEPHVSYGCVSRILRTRRLAQSMFCSCMCFPVVLAHSMRHLQPGDSIRQNIQFQAAFNPALYRSVIKACALDIDMRIWPQGDKQKAQGPSQLFSLFSAILLTINYCRSFWWSEAAHRACT